jgi:predicted RNA-binding Zn-ribbon protein involved in translation (DUF1610 family)
MMLFVIAGTREIIRAGGTHSSQVRHCPQCGQPMRFRDATRRTYLTLFFIPILPLGAGRDGLACESCNTWIAPEAYRLGGMETV